MTQSINRRTYYKTIVEEAKKLSNYGIVCHALKDGTKQPAGVGWQKRTKTNLSTFKAGCVGVGILCGAASNVTVLDIDDVDAWNKLLSAAASHQQGDIDVFDNIPCVKTPSGGLHYYFAYNNKIGSKAKDIIAVDEVGERAKIDVDTRNDGGQVVCPPSLYCATKPDKKQFDGKPYVWSVSFEDIGGVENLEPMPEWLVDVLTQKLRIRIDGEGDFAFESLEEVPKVPKIKPREDNLDEPDNTKTLSLLVGKESTKSATLDPCDLAYWDSIAEDGVYEGAEESSEQSSVDNKHVKLTLEHVTKIVYGLKTARFASYDDWCHMLWAVARWQDEEGADEDATVEMLDEYCQLCTGYVSKRDVEKKYAEAFKRNGRASKVTMGTLMHWLKEDSPATLLNLFKDARAQEVEKAKQVYSAFSDTDDFYWIDFVKKYDGRVFDSQEELVRELSVDIHRVVAKVETGEGILIKKESESARFNSIKYCKKKGIEFPIHYEVAQTKTDRRGKQTTKTETVRTTIFDENLKLIPRFGSVVCKVENEDPRAFNMWQGFKAKKVDTVNMDLIQPILDMIKDVWAAGEPRTFEYILDWHSALVQFPGVPVGVAMTIIGGHGIGKNRFTDFMRNFVIGKTMSRETNGLDDIVRNFNTLLRGTKTVVVNELTSSGNWKGDFNKCKAIINSEVISIEPKGVDSYMIDNIACFYIFSNHHDCISLENGDRRYAIFEASGMYKGKDAYWTKLTDTCFNQECGDHFYTYLMTRKKLKSIQDVRDNNIPVSALKQEMIEMSEPSYKKFIRAVVEQWDADHDHEGNFITREFSDEELLYRFSYNDDGSVGGHDLYRQYVEWCRTNEEHKHSATKFGMEAKRLIKREKFCSGCVYYVNRALI